MEFYEYARELCERRRAGAVADERRRRAAIFFCHLQKTAGTTLIRRIRGDFPPSAPSTRSRPTAIPIARVISVDHLLSVWERRGDEIRVVTGHFPLCVTELLGGELHDADRAASSARPDGLLPATPSPRHPRGRRSHAGAGLRRRVPLPRPDPQPHDQDAFAGSGGDGRRRADPGRASPRERLERAKERLAGVDVVGLQEEFESFCARALASASDGRWTTRSRTSQRRTRELGPGFRDRILEDNAHDLELYEFARRLVAERAGVGARTRPRCIRSGTR